MRKSLALALALVFAFASVSLAATPSISGEFTATATHEDKEKFFGPYTNSAELSLSVSFASEEDNWDASFELKGLDDLDGVSLGRYIVNVKEDAFKFTAWGNYGTGNIGTLGDALGFLPVSGQNGNAEPKFRLTTNLGGVDAAVQVEHKGAIYLNGEMGFDQFTLGATVAHRTKSPENYNYNDFAVYGGADLGVVNVDAAFYATGAEEKDNTAI